MGFKFQYAFITVLLMQLLLACSSESACFKSAGAIISFEIIVDEFTTINIGEGIELVIIEGEATGVVVETGENIKGDISVNVINGQLNLANHSSCNWVRDYNNTKVYVTAPNIEKIYSSSQFGVKSDGVLAYPHLELQSGLYGETASGSFELEVNCESLIIQDNQSIYCHISGIVEDLSVNYYSGDARFDGGSLIAQRVNVFHRSSNDIIVNPQEEVKGTIYSTGNLILKNHPPFVEVGQLYTGTVLFQ